MFKHIYPQRVREARIQRSMVMMVDKKQNFSLSLFFSISIFFYSFLFYSILFSCYFNIFLYIYPFGLPSSVHTLYGRIFLSFSTLFYSTTRTHHWYTSLSLSLSLSLLSILSWYHTLPHSFTLKSILFNSIIVDQTSSPSISLSLSSLSLVFSKHIYFRMCMVVFEMMVVVLQLYNKKEIDGIVVAKRTNNDIRCFRISWTRTWTIIIITTTTIRIYFKQNHTDEIFLLKE